jgi:hypothetical protein
MTTPPSSSRTTIAPTSGRSAGAIHAPEIALAEMLNYLEQLRRLFARWNELSAREQHQIKTWVFGEFIVSLPDEMLEVMAGFFDGHSGAG